MSESMMHHWIMPINQRREAVFAPDQPTLTTFFRTLEFEAQSRLTPFILHTVEAAPLAPKADVLGFAETDAIDRLIGTGCQRLRQPGIDMVSDPATIGRLDKLVQGILGEAIGLS
jgi:hypothetical protein